MRLFSKLITTMLLSLGVTQVAQAQRSGILHMEDHDQKPYFFGISLGANTTSFKLHQSQSFALNDTFYSVQPGWGTGFHIGILGDLKLTNFVDLRFIPTIIFTEKYLTTTNAVRVEEKKTIESIYAHLPVQLKFKSDRIGNFRFYGIAGAKFDYDLSSNARSRRTDEFLKVKAMSLGGEVGIGFEFYYPNFIFSPEIKIGHSFVNEHAPDNTIPLSNTIDKLSSKMIMFTIHLQG